MKHVRQPPNSNCCGQACLAMLCHISLPAACRLIGHSHGTHTKEIVTVLRRHGWKCPDRLVRMSAKRAVPDVALVKMIGCVNPREAHWLILDHGQVLDPGVPAGQVSPHSRLSSFLPITRDNHNEKPSA